MASSMTNPMYVTGDMLTGPSQIRPVAHVEAVVTLKNTDPNLIWPVIFRRC